MLLTTRAPAKVNLTLKVMGRRPDGYHELHSLTAFAAAANGLAHDPGADRLSLTPGTTLSLTVAGASATDAGPDDDNLVLRAARHLARLCPGLETGRFSLEKHLPVAAGLGGGSSDAAAALRVLAQLNGLAVDDPRLHEAARATGADVPVCLRTHARIMTGVGDVLGPELALPQIYAVLVNPRLAVPTPAVFAALGAPPLKDQPENLADLQPDLASDAALRRYLLASGNDLEAPALAICPQIGDGMGLLRDMEGCWLARMSGSGATVFGLFGDMEQAASAASRMATSRPGWWVCPTQLA